MPVAHFGFVPVFGKPLDQTDEPTPDDVGDDFGDDDGSECCGCCDCDYSVELELLAAVGDVAESVDELIDGYVRLASAFFGVPPTAVH